MGHILLPASTTSAVITIILNATIWYNHYTLFLIIMSVKLVYIMEKSTEYNSSIKTTSCSSNNVTDSYVL